MKISKFFKIFLSLVVFLIFVQLTTLPISAAATGGVGGSSSGEVGGGSSGTASKGVGQIDPTVLGVPTKINDIISSVVQLAYAVAGLVFFFMLLFGGIRYLSAGGDEKAAAAARGTLTNAVIGLIIVVAAFLVTQLLFSIFKIQGIKLG